MLTPRRELFLKLLFGATVFFLSLSCGPSIVRFQPTQADFSFVAIGDVGEAGDILKHNAAVMRKMYREDKFHALIFLGDNFYPIGLNIPRAKVSKKIKSVLDPFNEVTNSLGRTQVHALAGNHDYYAFLAVNFKLPLNIYSVQTAPYGISDLGNQRADTIRAWTYYKGLPQTVLYGPDTNKIQMIFLDSALPLRTDTTTWQPALDSLHQLLTAHKQNDSVKWRLLFLHHPFYTLGPHGGYKHWDEEANTVRYLNPCSKDSNAVDFAVNLLDPEDTCAPKYQAYMRAVQAVIARSGVAVQAAIAGHEHVLQLAYKNTGHPKVHVVSGAGAKASRVKAGNPQRQEYTWWNSFDPDDNVKKKGISKYGFVRFDLKGQNLELRFYNGETGEVLAAEGERKVFVINRAGELSLR